MANRSALAPSPQMVKRHGARLNTAKAHHNSGIVTPLPHPAPKNQCITLGCVDQEDVNPAGRRHQVRHPVPIPPQDDTRRPNKEQRQNHQGVRHTDSPLLLGQHTLDEVRRTRVMLLELQPHRQIPVGQGDDLATSYHEGAKEHREKGDPDSQMIRLILAPVLPPHGAKFSGGSNAAGHSRRNQRLEVSSMPNSVSIPQGALHCSPRKSKRARGLTRRMSRSLNFHGLFVFCFSRPLKKTIDLGEFKQTAGRSRVCRGSGYGIRVNNNDPIMTSAVISDNISGGETP
jgi:hypothetical protein